MTVIARKGMSLTDNIEDYPEGIIIPVDKPYRWTSADVIRKVKWAACRHFHKKNLKVGHAGTLDPLATGVLLVCIGKATKLAESLQKHDKEYIAGINFGATTPSYDREKDIDERYPLDGVSETALKENLPGFLGDQEQVAPLFSAKSIDGVRAYELARKAYKAAKEGLCGFDHSEAGLLSRQNINISRLDLLEFDLHPEEEPVQTSEENRFNSRINVTDVSGLGLPRAKILVGCSKGTYIRALARDLGEALGSGAFLDSLRRTATGSFRIEDCLSVSEAMEMLGRNTDSNQPEFAQTA